MKARFLLFVAILIGAGTAFADDSKSSLLDYFHVTVVAEPKYSKEADINASHFGVTVGRKDIQEILTPFGADIDNADIIWNLSVKVSSVPALMRKSTQEKLWDKVDHSGEAVWAGLDAQVRAQVLAGLNKNPQYAQLPLATQQGLFQKTYDTAIVGVKAQFDAAISARKDQIEDRLHRSMIEMSVQEVAIGFLTKDQSGHVVIFGKLGKFKPQAGANMNEDGLSEQDVMRVDPSRAQRGVRAAPTTGAGGGVILTNGNAAIRVEAYMFHNRAVRERNRVLGRHRDDDSSGIRSLQLTHSN